MYDEGVVDVPALLRVVDDLRQRFLGHPRVMLERKRAHLRCVVEIAHHADKRRDCADALVPGPQGGELGRDIEIMFLNADGHRASASGDQRKQGDLVVVPDWRRRLCEVMIHRDPDGSPGRELVGPDATPSPQPRQQRGDGPDVAGQIDLLHRLAECISETSKVDNANHGQAESERSCVDSIAWTKNASGTKKTARWRRIPDGGSGSA